MTAYLGRRGFLSQLAATGLAAEALTAAIAQGDDEAKKRMKAFLEKRGPKVARS